MKKYFLFACVAAALVSCSSDDFLGENQGLTQQTETGAILFQSTNMKASRADKVGATAAELLGGNFIVEGTKGTEAADAPSSSVVFDNYLVAYTENTAGTTESNTHNWEYVGKETGTTLVPSATWTALHAGTTDAKSQTIKYWDYSTEQYDFIAYSTGSKKAVAAAPSNADEVQVTRIATGTTLATNAYQFTATSVDAIKECYITDITPVKKTAYGNVVTLTFKNLSSKIRVGIYETIPGYSVKAVKFYTSDGTDQYNYDAGTKLAAETPLAGYYTLADGVYTACASDAKADGTTTYYKMTSLKPATSETVTLFTTGDDKLPASGTITVCYPHIGSGNSTEADYNKASIEVTPGTGVDTKLTYGTLTDNYGGKHGYEADGKYLGITLHTATMAGAAADDFFTPVMPNNNGKPLTLRCDYTLVSTDGSGETINVYGAKAVVPATYTEWQPNYAYTYIFKISDNSNGWTSTDATLPVGLFPITFDAVVSQATDFNAEQTTITSVATPSITTYQQGHVYDAKDEYSKASGKNIYVQVMDNSVNPATLVTTLADANSKLFSIPAGTTEAQVLDVLQNRTNDIAEASPVGRNGITLTTNANISNTVTTIENGVDDEPIVLTSAGKAAAIDIASLTAGTYAYVYIPTASTSVEKVYHIATPADDTEAAKYYEVEVGDLTEVATATTAAAGKVYFVANKNAEGNIVSYTFKQTKVGEAIPAGYFVADIPSTKATAKNTDRFYFDVYFQNNGKYATKVIKVVD